MKKRKKTLIARPQLDRDVFTILHALRGIDQKVIAKKTYLSPTTIKKTRQGPSRGGTRWPRHSTMCELARIAGMQWSLVPQGSEPGKRIGNGRVSRHAENRVGLQ